MKFGEINFGKASGEIEGAECPELLLNGFFDGKGIISKLQNTSSFLILGHKGSGKSSIGEHFRLIAEKDPLLFVEQRFLADFPFKPFSKIIGNEIESEAKLPVTWTWILLLLLLSSFKKDQAIESKIDSDQQKTLDFLTERGLLQVSNLQRLVLNSTKVQFKSSLGSFLEANYETSGDTAEEKFIFFVEHIKELFTTFHTDSQHYLIIDGFDDIFSSNSIRYETLSALIFEAHRLNIYFRRNSVPAKIIVLCRTDLFERLPGPNKNKIRQDSAIELNWYHDTRNPSNSDLFTLGNIRSQLVFPDVADFVSEFFPSESFEKDIYPLLLEQTRHHPRDFLQLLAAIQQFSGEEKLNTDQILSGFRYYSQHYFLPEIKDEMVGYVSEVDAENFLKLLASMRKFEFYIKELQAKADLEDAYKNLNLKEMLTILFECSAIGSVSDDKKTYVFRYRNRSLPFDCAQRIVIHKGLWKAFNLV